MKEWLALDDKTKLDIYERVGSAKNWQRRWSSENSTPKDITYQNFLAGCFFIICCIGFIIGILHIDLIITGFVNPEYGAMTDIMDFIEKIRAK